MTAESRSLPKAKVDDIKGVKKSDEQDDFSPECPAWHAIKKQPQSLALWFFMAG